MLGDADAAGDTKREQQLLHIFGELMRDRGKRGIALSRDRAIRREEATQESTRELCASLKGHFGYADFECGRLRDADMPEPGD